MRKKGKFHGSLLSAVMILVILFTALGEKGISAKAETSEKEEVKEQIEEKRNRIRNAYFPEADVADRSAKEVWCSVGGRSEDGLCRMWQSYLLFRLFYQLF